MNYNVLRYFSTKLNLNFELFLHKNSFFIRGRTGVVLLRCPPYFFVKKELNGLNFIFLNNWYFFTFVNQFFFFFRSFFKIFFFRLKLKGLGYRIRRINYKLYRFFLANNHYVYFFVPINIIVRHKKRNLLALSMDKTKLNNLFSSLLLIKKLDFYERTNSFIIPKKILFIKK